MKNPTNNRTSSGANPVPPEPTGSEADPRLVQIDRYKDAALQNNDPLAANLGLVTGGLLKVTYWQEQLLNSAYEHCADTPHGREQLRIALDDHLRVTRQVERYMQLEIRSAEIRKGR